MNGVWLKGEQEEMNGGILGLGKEWGYGVRFKVGR